jgi:hypothetical protein
VATARTCASVGTVSACKGLETTCLDLLTARSSTATKSRAKGNGMSDAKAGGMNDTNTNIAAAGFVGIVLVEVALLLFGVHGAARRAGDSAPRSRWLTVIVGGGIALWLAVTALLAATGALSDFTSTPPRLMIVIFAAMGLFAVVTSTSPARRLLAAMPKHWPIALHTIRIPIELALWGLFAAGRLPVQMTFEGRNFDVLVGLSAPIVALLVARRRLGKRGALVWNLFSFGLLLNIMGIAVTTFPGPLHLDWPGVSNVILATPPFVWLPAFLVPVAFFGHVLSFRQLLARSYTVDACAPPSSLFSPSRSSRRA